MDSHASLVGPGTKSYWTSRYQDTDRPLYGGRRRFEPYPWDHLSQGSLMENPSTFYFGADRHKLLRVSDLKVRMKPESPPFFYYYGNK